MTATLASTDNLLIETLARLLGGMPDRVEPCAGGGNNRVFRVEHAGKAYVAKRYFQSAADMRDRQDSEWRFLSYARQLGIENVPQPIARDDAAAIALYSFLDGARPEPGDIDADKIRQAGQFIRALNTKNASPAALALPLASESCFSAQTYIDVLRRRIERLRHGSAHADHVSSFQALCAQMGDAFARHAKALTDGYAALGIAADEPLPQAARCLSPSDFGFHNSLLNASGHLQFLDFEYAGWDDPAKMLCDFFLHPGIPVDAKWAGVFWDEIKDMPIDRSQLLDRARLLYPLFGLRWCCIILNVFVPDWAARRAFADSAWDARLAQQQQLDKARQMLYTLDTEPFKDLC